jgi:hypothetical protein
VSSRPSGKARVADAPFRTPPQPALVTLGAVRARCARTARGGGGARRAGHGVAVLLKIHAHCIDGQAHTANKRITDALSSQDTEPRPR